MDRGLNHSGGETEVLVLGARNAHADGQGAADLINAAPALLEVVAAALAWQETLGAPRGDRRADAAERELLAALAKVRQ